MDNATIIGALIAGIALAVGTVLGAVLEDWRLKASEKRRHEREARQHLVERLDATRTMLEAQLDAALSLAVGDGKGAARAQRRGTSRVRASLKLVGDDDVVRAYGAALIDFQRGLGTSVRAEDRIRMVEVMGRVNDALDAQEERVWKGEALHMLSPGVEAEMADVRTTASQMLLFDQPSSIPGQIARWVIVHLWRPKP